MASKKVSPKAPPPKPKALSAPPEPAPDPQDEWVERSGIIRRPLAMYAGDEKEMAEWLLKILQEEGGKHPIVFDEGDFYEYLPWEGVWRIVDPVVLSQIVQSFSGSKVPEGPNSKREKFLKVSLTAAKGAIQLAADRAASPGFFANAPGGIAFTNGFVRVSASGVGALEPLAPDHRVRTRFSFDYDARADAPMFTKFLEEIFRDDEDREEKRACLQEFFGACRAGIATRFQKCLFLRSPGGGGRSTLLAIVEKAFTPETVVGIKPQQFPDSNRRAMLAGKLLNYADECPSASLLESDWFKQIVTGDWTDACLKYKNPIRFRPIAGHCFLANELPATTDLSDAFFRRLIVFAFNRQFHEEKTRDLGLGEKIVAAELPGVISWMLQGVVRLLKQGHYTLPKSHHDESLAWRTKSDSVALFLDEKASPALDIDRKKWLAADHLYRCYRQWAEDCGHRYPVSSTVFGLRLKALQIPSARGKQGVRYAITLARQEGVGLVQGFLTRLHLSRSRQPTEIQ